MSKAELEEQVDLLEAQLEAANAEIKDLKTAISKKVKQAKAKAQKQSDQLEKERKVIYDEAKDVYTQSLKVARDVYASYEKEVAANLGIVAQQVREQIMYTLSQVFGDDLTK